MLKFKLGCYSYVPIYSSNKVCSILYITLCLSSLFTESFSIRSWAVSWPTSQPPLGARPVGQEQPGSLLLNIAKYVQEPLCVTLTVHIDNPLSSATKRAQRSLSTYSANSEKKSDRGHNLTANKIKALFT